MTDALRVYFAFRSPFSRLGLHKLVRSGIANHVPLSLIPFTGPAGDAQFLDPMSSAPKQAYFVADALRMTQRMDLPMAMPDPFEVSVTRATLSFMLADRLGKGMEFALAVSDARWGAGLNISNMEVLADCAEAAGLERELPKQAKGNAELGAALEAVREDIDKDLVFGVPFAVLEKKGRTQSFWGQDRFDLLIENFAS